MKKYLFNARSGHTKDQFITAIYQLAQLLKADVSIADALDDLYQMEPGRLSAGLWKHLADSVRSGRTLSQSLCASQWHRLFDPTAIALIRVGETNGDLVNALFSVHRHLESQRRLRQSLKTILIYPLLSLLVSLLSIGFTLIYVVPPISVFLRSSGDLLAWHTRWLIGLSETLQSYWPWFAGLVLVICLALFVLPALSQTARRLIDRGILCLPLVSDTAIDLYLSRYAYCLANLYGAGVELDKSLQIAESGVENLVLRQQLTGVRKAVNGGQSLAGSLQQIHCMPRLIARMVHIGEASGSLHDTLVQIARYQQQRTDTTLARLQQLLAPCILLMIGFCLIWVIVSVLSPVYDTAIATVLQA